MGGRIHHWLSPLVWAFIVLVLCGLPGQHIPEINFWKWLRWDKVTHLIMFGILAYLTLRASRRSSDGPIGYLKVWGWVSLTVLYGALIEILQLTVFTGRSGDFRDALANGLGAVIGLAYFRFRYKADYQR